MKIEVIITNDDSEPLHVKFNSLQEAIDALALAHHLVNAKVFMEEFPKDGD